jgi:hypothetical protein
MFGLFRRNTQTAVYRNTVQPSAIVTPNVKRRRVKTVWTDDIDNTFNGRIVVQFVRLSDNPFSVEPDSSVYSMPVRVKGWIQ